ncbi:MAG: hypothetical protein U1E81_06180 [Xanthobacteraceae bacterium]
MRDNVNCIETFTIAHRAGNHLCSRQFAAQEHRDYFGTQSSNKYRNIRYSRIDENNLTSIAHERNWCVSGTVMRHLKVDQDAEAAEIVMRPPGAVR